MAAPDRSAFAPPAANAASNVPELTVGELSGALKRTIEDRFGFVRVRGEISNYRGPHSSGHAYFCLKDDQARIDAVIWKTAFSRLKIKPQEGLEVIATGKVTTFPGKSTYQIVIEAIEPAGIGALMALLEARRQSLAAEGLFDAARKLPIPFLPRTIGVVTSPTGAVIRDIAHRIEDRFPRAVLVWPVRVQGDTAAAEVALAIDGFNALPVGGVIARPDVIIVARGGGSLEDLWAFNEEVVIRAVSASRIPLIAAVGHETDWTLIDHVADLRAPTPSGAAEKAVPVRAELLTQQRDLTRRHAAAMLRLSERRRGDVRGLARLLPSADSIVAVPRQQLDRAEARLQAALSSAADRRKLRLSQLGHRLSQQAPGARLEQTKNKLIALELRLTHCVERSRERHARTLAHCAQRLESSRHGLAQGVGRGRERQDRAALALNRAWHLALRKRLDMLERCERLLNTLGYKQVLARGFSLVRDGEGRPIRSATQVGVNAALDIEFIDGHIGVRTGEPSSSPVRKPRPKLKTEQGSLF